MDGPFELPQHLYTERCIGRVARRRTQRTQSIEMSRQLVADLVTQAGSAKLAEDSALLPYQYILTFEKP